jgi:hypothetical protein
MEEWKSGRMEEWEEWKSGRMEGWKNGRMEEWKNGRMEEWKDGRMEGWKSGRRWPTSHHSFLPPPHLSLSKGCSGWIIDEVTKTGLLLLVRLVGYTMKCKATAAF